MTSSLVYTTTSFARFSSPAKTEPDFPHFLNDDEDEDIPQCDGLEDEGRHINRN